MIRYVPAVLIGRTVRWAARKRKPGGGAAMPGVVVNAIAPNFLPKTLASFPQGLVVVTGTAGKSTTTRLLAAIVSAHGVKVFTNPSTANIAQGLTSAIISTSSLSGRIDADLAILEMDEGHAAALSSAVKPRLSVLLNVCVDQVDRFFDPNIVTQMLAKVASNTTAAVVVNHDDDSISQAVAGVSAEKVTFGMGEQLFERERDNLGYVTPRVLGAGPAHASVLLRAVGGRTATIDVDGETHDVRIPSVGVHYGVDTVAAISAARALLGSDFSLTLAVSVIDAIDPVFGRGENIEIAGQKIDCILIQNPTSFRLNVLALDPETEHIMIAVGSDVRDYSYLWSAHIDHLQGVRIAAGPKAVDVALHCTYNGVPVDGIEPDLGLALEQFLALPSPTKGNKTIIFSADSMRRTRRYFGLPEQEAAG